MRARIKRYEEFPDHLRCCEANRRRQAVLGGRFVELIPITGGRKMLHCPFCWHKFLAVACVQGRYEGGDDDEGGWFAAECLDIEEGS